VELKDRKDIQAPATGTEILKERTGIPQPVVQSPYYRRVFVGRETELGELRSAFDNAILGQGSLVMVVGEPGIGKTVLCEQLAAYVSSLGGKSQVGHCYSERSLSLPYLAFVEVLRSYVQAQDVSELRKELRSGAADLGRIVPEIKEKLKVHPRPKRDPEEERYRLMEAVTQFLGSIATVQPLLIVLEDLHNADSGTLEMLTHVSRNLAGIRLLLVGTYRDIEIDRTHPLSATLAELRRLPAFRRVLLRGLNADEVGRMLASITGQEVPWGLVEAIHRRTEGNPLFIQEVMRYLFEEGFISPQGEVRQKPRDIPVEMKIPDGLRDVIGKRLSRLSESCNRVLSVAAVIGRDFRLEVLQKVAGISDEELFKALEEARKAAVVEERAGAGAVVNYRFAHAFFRQTLYEEIIAPRRIRLHQQVARVLEDIYKNRLEQHAAELAEHLSHSPDSADLKKAVSYGEMAAQRATSVYAYGEAVRLLDQALKVQEVLDPEDKAKRCDLLLALSETLLSSGEPRRILDVELPAAFRLAEDISDSVRASRICTVAVSALICYASGPGLASPELTLWAERADRYAQPGTVLRARADMILGVSRMNAGHLRSGVRLLTQALQLARNLGDPDTFWSAAFMWLFLMDAPQHTEERLQLAEEVARGPRTGVNLQVFGWNTLNQLGHAFLVSGQRQRAEQAWGELRDLAERSRHVNIQIVSMAHNAILAFMDGHLEDAVKISRQIRARGAEVDMPVFIGMWEAVGDLPQRYLGYTGDTLQQRYREWEELQILNPARRAFVMARLGRHTEATEILEQFVVRRRGIGSPEDETPGTSWDAYFLQVAVLVGHRQAAELLLRRFAGSGVRTTGFFYPTCIARHLGGACALLNRPDEARKYYDEAIKVCTEMRFRPELALTRLQLAELLLEHYPNEKKEALEHLDFAISEFRDMKMQPSLERALRHKEILKA
jgi:tetratricopeptide (TPR) repeat protein